MELSDETALERIGSEAVLDEPGTDDATEDAGAVEDEEDATEAMRDDDAPSATPSGDEWQPPSHRSAGMTKKGKRDMMNLLGMGTLSHRSMKFVCIGTFSGRGVPARGWGYGN